MTAIKFFLIFAGLIVAYAAFVLINLKRRFNIATKLAKNTTAFSNRGNGAKFRMLFLGDDLALGVGADNSKKSIAGRMAEALPYGEVYNYGESGLTIKMVLDSLPPRVPNKFYDIIFIQTGINDILRNIPAENAVRYLREILVWARERGKLVVLIGVGNIGAAPIFPLPLGYWYTRRAKIFSNAFKFMAEEKNALFVELWEDAENDLFVLNPAQYYAKDFFHPSADGYGVWFEKIKSALFKSGLRL